MGSFKFHATLAATLGLATAAHAADLMTAPPPPPAPVPVDVGGGWYLRGDVGVSVYDAEKVKNVVGASTQVYDRDFGSGAFAGAGVGYQFASWFRADVTGEYRFSDSFSWRDRGPVGTSAVFYNPGTGVYDTYTANGTSYEKTKIGYSSAVVLVNGYFDLGNYWGVTPFLGGGVGYAYHFLHDGDTGTINAYGNYVNAYGVTQPGSPAAGVSGGSIHKHDSGDFAWALHAGLGYDVTPNVKLELAYRYLNMGDVKTGTVNCFCGQVSSGYTVKDLEAHDIKIGMRWLLGGPVATVADYGPIVRKY